FWPLWRCSRPSSMPVSRWRSVNYVRPCARYGVACPGMLGLDCLATSGGEKIMASFSDELMAEVVRTQVRLQACRARLTARTDDEALHDLRIALRKLRSLLRPLRGLPGVEVLEQA